MRTINQTHIGSFFLLLIILFALFGPMLSSHTYFDTHLNDKNQPPSKAHFFGTDELGRDLFTRTAYGARISLSIGFAAAIIDLILGVFWGGVAGYAGGKTEEVMMRIADILFAFPYLLCVIAIMVVLQSGIFSILIAMTFIGWITMARVVRGSVLQIKQQEFIQAARVLGASHLRIILKHIIPNASGPIIVTTMLTVPSAMFTEAFLSFLGLGVQAPHASWGVMVNDGLSALHYYPWRLFFPAFFISLTMLSLNLIGDGLRDRFDPRHH